MAVMFFSIVHPEFFPNRREGSRNVDMKRRPLGIFFTRDFLNKFGNSVSGVFVLASPVYSSDSHSLMKDFPAPAFFL